MAARRTFAPRGTRRLLQWTNVLTDASTLGLASGKSVGALSATGVTFAETLTLVRSRGSAIVHFDPTAAGDVVQFGLGLGVFTVDAFTVGATAMPGPITDAGWDWVYYKVLNLGPSFTATEDSDGLIQNWQIEVDSKAMRKLKDNSALGWIAEMAVLSGGGTVDFGVSCRHLLKLA